MNHNSNQEGNPNSGALYVGANAAGQPQANALPPPQTGGNQLPAPAPQPQAPYRQDYKPVYQPMENTQLQGDIPPPTTSATAQYGTVAPNADGNVVMSVTQPTYNYGITQQPQHAPPRMKPRVLGNGRRRCGCCISPRDGSNSYVLSVIVLLPVVVFMTSIEEPEHWWSFAITAALTVCDLACLLLATGVDPGILLPVEPDPLRKSEIVMVNGVNIECKVCTTCHIVRPPRSSHCHSCDWCVEDFDHHCGVLGSCVAKRTFRFFAGFMWFGTALALWVWIRTVMFLEAADMDKLQDSHWGRWRIAAAIGCLIYVMIGGCCLFGQGAYYCQLSCRNETQKDHYRLNRKDPTTLEIIKEKHVYDKGCFRNFYEKILSPLGESRIKNDMV